MKRYCPGCGGTVPTHKTGGLRWCPLVWHMVFTIASFGAWLLLLPWWDKIFGQYHCNYCQAQLTNDL